MKYLFEAFGNYDPETDIHAAVKFCVALAVSYRQFGDLAQLLTESSQKAGFGSDPGWLLEKRVGGDPEQMNWPQDAMFRASVEPRGYELGHPEGFYTREEFCKYVLVAINAHVAEYPSHADDVAPVRAALKGGDDPIPVPATK